MTSCLRTAAVIVSTVLALSACSDESPTAEEPVSGSPDSSRTPTPSVPTSGTSTQTASTQNPQVSALGCPRLIPFVDPGENPTEPEAVSSVDVPPRALHCTYDIPPRTDPKGWLRRGKPKALTEAERASLFSQLSWKPAARDRMCTMDLGPLQVLTWPEAGGTTMTLMMEDYGCRATYVVTDPRKPATTAELEIPEPVVKLLSDRF